MCPKWKHRLREETKKREKKKSSQTGQTYPNACRIRDLPCTYISSTLLPGGRAGLAYLYEVHCRYVTVWMGRAYISHRCILPGEVACLVKYRPSTAALDPWESRVAAELWRNMQRFRGAFSHWIPGSSPAPRVCRGPRRRLPLIIPGCVMYL